VDCNDTVRIFQPADDPNSRIKIREFDPFRNAVLLFRYAERACLSLCFPNENIKFRIVLRLSENAHLLRYPHPSSLGRTSMYASFLGISEALHMAIFHQPL